MASFSSEPIPWDDHVRWFESRLNDANCLFYIAVDDDGTPVGQMRCEDIGGEAVVSISVERAFRGSGYGGRIIKMGSREIFHMSGHQVIHAYIKPDNTASETAFLKAGFTPAGEGVFGGRRAIHLLRHRGGQE
jgi:UDP-2,4-diacetamido-2,4,6-trideoxy-beta-L-altropyranose hydrolase